MTTLFSADLLLSNMPGLVYRCKLDADWTMDYISAGATELTGYGPHMFHSRSVSYAALIHPEDRAAVWETVAAAANAGVPFGMTYRIVDAAGKERWVWEQGKPVNDGSQVVAIEGFITDVTRQRATLEELHQNNLHLSLILELSGEGICGVNRAYVCTFINPAGAAMLGYRPEELIGQPLHELIRPRQANGSPSPIETCEVYRALAINQTLRVEDDAFLRRDGTLLPVSFVVAPMVQDGEPHGAVVTFTDITHRKQALESAREAARHAEVAAEANAKYRALFEQAAFFFILLSMDGTVLELNRAASRASGFAPEMIVGRKFWEAPWWSRLPHSSKTIQHGCLRAAKGEVCHLTEPFNTVDGQKRVAASSLAPVMDANKNVLYIQAIGIDITESRQTEAALRASEERYRLLTEMSPDGILVQTGNRWVYANQSALAMLGATDPNEVLGHSIFDVIHPDFHDVVRKRLRHLAQNHPLASTLDERWLRVDGVPIEVQVTGAMTRWGDMDAIQVLLRDVTVQKQTQRSLRALSERLQIAAEGTGEAIWNWDIPDNAFSFSGMLQQITGHAPETYNGDTRWYTLLHPDDLGRVTAKFLACTTGNAATFEAECRLKTTGNAWRWVWARGAVVDRDRYGTPIRMTGTLIDITDKKEADEKIWQHANICPLTHLPNRRQFRELLELEMRHCQRAQQTMALLFIDLDGFKQVNDLFGHEAGDFVLYQTALRLRQCVRASDTVARLGGDEFTVILTDLNNRQADVEQVCAKVIQILAEPIAMDGDTAYVSASIGVALYPIDAATPDELLRKADQAMYAAKQNGKNAFHYFTPELDARAHTRLHLTNELRRALERHQFTVHYQPVISVRDSRILKVEALLRWHHPVLGAVSPAEFIPLAEESGTILAIERWVLHTACAQNMAWQALGLPPLRMSVNLSARHFGSDSLIDDIEQALAQSGMPASQLEIELTESMLAPHPGRAQTILARIKAMGVKLAIDDFGTGYSSLAQLKDYPVDTLKVDQSFIRNIAHSGKDQSVTLGIIAMGKSMGLTVVAEGVETAEQQAFLDNSACDESQGFLFSRPLPSAALEALLRTQHRRA